MNADAIIEHATRLPISTYRIVQSRMLSDVPLILEYDGSYAMMCSLLDAVRNSALLREHVSYNIACRVLRHYVEHFTSYTFALIPCIVLSNTLAIINVHLCDAFEPFEQTADGQRIPRVARLPYAWNTSHHAPCIYIDCGALDDALTDLALTKAAYGKATDVALFAGFALLVCGTALLLAKKYVT